MANKVILFSPLLNNAFLPLQIHFLPFASSPFTLCFILYLCTPAKTSSSLLLGHPSQLPAIPPFFLAAGLHPLLLLLDTFPFSSARHSPHLIANMLSRRKHYYGLDYFPAKQNKHHKPQKFLVIPIAEFLTKYVLKKKKRNNNYSTFLRKLKISNHKNRENCTYTGRVIFGQIVTCIPAGRMAIPFVIHSNLVIRC